VLFPVEGYAMVPLMPDSRRIVVARLIGAQCAAADTMGVRPTGVATPWRLASLSAPGRCASDRAAEEMPTACAADCRPFF
jgi:hypothetical protein